MILLPPAPVRLIGPLHTFATSWQHPFYLVSVLPIALSLTFCLLEYNLGLYHTDYSKPVLPLSTLNPFTRIIPCPIPILSYSFIR